MDHEGGHTLMWWFIWSYVDDDAAGTLTVRCHLFVLECLFVRFKIFGFKIRLPKCVFLVLEVKFLGYLVSHKKVRADPKRAALIHKIPRPETYKDLKALLGMAQWYLRRFATEYNMNAVVLSNLLRGAKDVKGASLKDKWREEHEVAFSKIKGMCTRELLNHTFDPARKDTALYFDWSKQGISAVLVQGDKVIRVWGRACNKAEANYYPTKGEFLAKTWAQRQARKYLLASAHPYLLVTDHRPILGLDKKLELENNTINTWRIATEETSKKGLLVYVRGSKQLADYWTRIWPSKELEDVGGERPAVALLTQADFADLDPPDTMELKKRKEKQGLRVEVVEDTGVTEVFTGGLWRTYIPARLRQSLICEHHLPDHPGEVELRGRLMSYYWPGKIKDVSNYLKTCFCYDKKAARTQRRESKASKENTKTDAGINRFLQVVQCDVYKWKDKNYLTFVDVHTGKPWCRALLKVGCKPGAHKMKVHNEYMIWESSLPRIPDRINCDNETTLTSIPHGKVTPTPVNHPQGNAMVERMHKELGVACRVHETTPEKAVAYLKKSRHAPTGGDGARRARDGVAEGPAPAGQGVTAIRGLGSETEKMKEKENPLKPSLSYFRSSNLGEIDSTEIVDSKSKFPRSHSPNQDEDEGKNKAGEASRAQEEPARQAYEGRELPVGSYVLRRIQNRGRKKDQPYWSTPAKVASRSGRKTYLVFDGTRVAACNIDDLKRVKFETGDHSILSDRFLESVRGWTGVAPSKAKVSDQSESWRGKVVWLGWPGRHKMEGLAQKVLKRKFKRCWLCFPHLPCERWFRLLDKMGCAAKWGGSDPGEEVWVSPKHGHSIRKELVTWWLLNVKGLD